MKLSELLLFSSITVLLIAFGQYVIPDYTLRPVYLSDTVPYLSGAWMFWFYCWNRQRKKPSHV